MTSLAWDGQTELQVSRQSVEVTPGCRQVDEESGQVELDTETENLLHQIEELTSTALRETNHWSLHINHDTNNLQGHAREHIRGVQEEVVENDRNSLSANKLGFENITSKEDSNIPHGHRGGHINMTLESKEYINANNQPENTVRSWDSGAYSDTPNPLVTAIEKNANSGVVMTPMSISTSSCESVTGTARDNI